ncbi:enolase C-terminal domain-like protein [Herbiconiux sp.]|uniref:enolase C-terminal domain-like protein n=1 Tax=Herbiconiux sp. TaxID=1871186 RepID=UPI0025BF178A|nr:enolase C-terminal domain-like protein [Herbiconiux sp.]
MQPHEEVGTEEPVQIRNVTVAVAPFSSGTWLDESRVSTPLSRYPEFAERRSSWRGPGSGLVWVLIETDDPEVFGVGQSRGGVVTAALIEGHFRGLLLGRDALDLETRVDQLHLAALPYAAGGISSMALSACELALWDLAARASGVSLAHLLGGSDRPLRHYLTCPEPQLLDEVDPDLIATSATVKVPMAYGPAAGREGLLANLARLDETRDRVPAHVPLSVDCFMSWDLDYATAFLREASGHHLGWIEEPLLPDDLAGYAELRRSQPVAVAGGEHLFGLTEAQRFLQADCADVIQVDVTWCGGLGTARAVAELAGARGVTFAPHGAAMHPWAVALLSSLGGTTLTEVLIGLGGAVDYPRASTGPGVGIDPASVGLG